MLGAIFYVLSAFRATHNALVSRSSLFLAVNRARALDPFPPSSSVPPPWINSTRRLYARASSARRESTRHESKIRAHFFRSPASSRPPPSPPARARSVSMSSSRRRDARPTARISAIDLARVPSRRRARPPSSPPSQREKINGRATPASRVAHAPVRVHETRRRARVGVCGAMARAGAAAVSNQGGRTRSRVTTGRLSTRAVLSRPRARGRCRSTQWVKSPHTTREDARERPSARARGGDRPPGRLDG